MEPSCKAYGPHEATERWQHGPGHFMAQIAQLYTDFPDKGHDISWQDTAAMPGLLNQLGKTLIDGAGTEQRCTQGARNLPALAAAYRNGLVMQLMPDGAGCA